MKTILLSLVFLLTYSAASGAAPQDRRQQRIQLEQAQTDSLMQARSYRFELQTLNVMVPSLGTMRGVEAGYYVEVTPAYLEVNIPFFGTFTDNYFDTSKSIRFRNSKYGYSQYRNGEGQWNIIISATGNSGEGYTFYLTVSARGGAFLRAVNQQRITISYDGIITPADGTEPVKSKNKK